MHDPQSVGSALGGVSEVLTLRKTSAGTYNPVTRTYTGETTTNYAISGFADPYKAHEVDGQSIVRGDRRYWVPQTALDPHGVGIAVGDKIIRASKEYRVEDVVEPAGPSIVYVVQVRGVE